MDRLIKIVGAVATGVALLTGGYTGLTKAHDKLQEYDEMHLSIRQLQGDVVLANMRLDLAQLKEHLKQIEDENSEHYQDEKANLAAKEQEMRYVQHLYRDRDSDTGYYEKYYAKQ